MLDVESATTKSNRKSFRKTFLVGFFFYFPSLKLQMVGHFLSWFVWRKNPLASHDMCIYIDGQRSWIYNTTTADQHGGERENLQSANQSKYNFADRVKLEKKYKKRKSKVFRREFYGVYFSKCWDIFSVHM